MQTKEDKTVTSNSNDVKPIEYLGGVMDEETRPLLKAYVSNLQDGEGVLVVYRLGNTSDKVLLESDIEQISGRDWDHVSGREGNEPMQELVNNLSKTAMQARVANILFSQADLKVKAFDAHKIAFGIVGNGTPVTSIKGIVHQQLNMGLNGDLLLHEGDIIMNSLVEHNVFKDKEGRSRPLQVKTYGAGGSASINTNPGKMEVSDGVIDIRTHIDPRCIMKYLTDYVNQFKEKNVGVRTTAHDEFSAQIEEMKLSMDLRTRVNPHNQQQEEMILNKDYTGIEMVHDIAKLARLASVYTDIPTTEIMRNFKQEDKQYYGEITFGTVNTGVKTIHRIETDREGKPFLGDKGQGNALNCLQGFLKDMTHIDESAYNKQVSEIYEKMHANDKKIAELKIELFSLLTTKATPETKDLLRDLEEQTYEALDKLEKSNTLLLSTEDPVIKDEMEIQIARLEQELNEFLASEAEIVEGVIPNLAPNAAAVVPFKKNEIKKLAQANLDLENELTSLGRHHSDVVSSDQKLKREIQKDKEYYKWIHPNHEFSVTASGNIFFTAHDKTAIGTYGAKTVEMENQLFVQLIQRSVANQIFIDSEYITKIAADPLKIEDSITTKLNEWAAQHTMTVDDYVQAVMWANKGQSFVNFPDCGRWSAAEDLYKSNPECRERFYSFGTDDQNPIIINPFWKEIGTDLVKEISEGKAFKGEAFKNLAIAEDTKKELKILAEKIINEPQAEKTEQRVRELFTQYLNLMTPMHTEEKDKFRVYARIIPVLKAGFVKDPVSDWDQPIYKSTNTAVLDQQSAKFVAESKGKNIGGGLSLVSHQQPNPKNYAGSPTLMLRNMKKEKEPQRAAEMGKQYLESLSHNSQSELDQDKKKHITQIEGFIIKAECEKLLNEMQQYGANNPSLQDYIKNSRALVSQLDLTKPQQDFNNDLHNGIKKVLVDFVDDMKKHSVGTNDVLLQQYIEETKAIITNLDLTVPHQELQSINNIQKAISSNEVEKIKDIISTMRREGTSEWLSIGKTAKADRIERALQNVGVDKREHVFSDPIVGKEVREALASQRHLGKQGDVYKDEKGNIDVERAANSYKSMHTFFAVKPQSTPEHQKDVELVNANTQSNK